MADGPEGREGDFYRLHIMGDDGGVDMPDACLKLLEALDMRDKYHPSEAQAGGLGGRQLGPRQRSAMASMSLQAAPGATSPRSSKESISSFSAPTEGFKVVDGVVLFPGQRLKPASYSQYAADFKALQKIVEDGPCRSTCRSRLKILEWHAVMYSILNSPLEERLSSLNRGGGIYTTYKVDNSVRLSTCAGARDLLNFIIEKAVDHRDDVVNTHQGKEETLQQFLARHGIVNHHDLSVESLGLQPDANEHFYRFDIFSSKFSRGGPVSVELLRLFLKRDGKELKGRYYGELCQRVLQRDATKRPYIATEFKVPIFGTHATEGPELARWVHAHGLRSPTNRWVIQIPRIAEIRAYGMYKCATQQDQLDNIFLPLWEATAHPARHPELADFLLHAVGFSVISSEERSRGHILPPDRPPKLWPWSENPSDIYFNYYIWANVFSLNVFRAERGLNTFAIRPTCGEMGDLTHLVSAYLLADSINHGLKMMDSPVLQYLFYMKQIGIVASPLSNNGLFLQYAKNPFPLFLKCGLRVSLSTDDPLHFHYTMEPLIEEYGTAAKVLKLSTADLCETARNSVLISGFDHATKQRWLGQDYALGSVGNSFQHSHVPTIRLVFREEVRSKERAILTQAGRKEHAKRAAAGGKGDVRAPCPPPPPGDHDTARRPSDVPHENCETYVKFHRLGISGPPELAEAKEAAAALIHKALTLRQMYQQHQPSWRPPAPATSGVGGSGSGTGELEIQVQAGIVALYDRHTGDCLPVLPYFPSITDWAYDLDTLHNVWEDVAVKSLSYPQLQLLHAKFGLHNALNSEIEGASGRDEHRDFYQSYKVDNYVHMQSGMTAKQLLRFFAGKATRNAEDVVMVLEDQPVTISALLERLDVNPKTADIRLLTNPMALKTSEAMDDFGTNYTLHAESELYRLLLTYDNSMCGRYFAEVIKEAFHGLESDAYTFAEYGLMVAGHSRDEWKRLAHWQNTHGVASTKNKYRVQIPRLYAVARANDQIKNYGELLGNIFIPLWEVSREPSRNPILDHFLTHLSGFDVVANERALEPPFYDGDPEDWACPEDPGFSTWMYYMWVNVTILNAYRAQVGRSTFSFRVHCGDGSLKNLGCAFLTAESVVNGANVARDPALQYLYYLAQIPISMSPISTRTEAGYLQHPFPELFQRGLPIALSSHFPLQFHHTQEPLVEEYSIAAKLWKFSPTDLCELARHSVLQSGFSHATKRKWLGDRYFLASSAGNDPKLSHIPNIRVAYRFETYHAECHYMEQLLPACLRAQGFPRSMLTLAAEDALMQEMGLPSPPSRSPLPAPPEDTQSRASRDTPPKQKPAPRPSITKEELLEQRIRDLEQQIERLNAKDHTTSTAHTTNINKLTLINTGDSITNQFLGTTASGSTTVRNQSGSGAPPGLPQPPPTPAGFGSQENANSDAPVPEEPMTRSDQSMSADHEGQPAAPALPLPPGQPRAPAGSKLCVLM